MDDDRGDKNDMDDIENEKEDNNSVLLYYLFIQFYLNRPIERNRETERGFDLLQPW
ncbi:hypothetical protein CGMCC3_g16759 [Colletotrichum fructicola]|nr:uncharacterized protein CGMCC3_g16759 [Colletotrichum fructicola]KAE9567088.1 hypothetical protein CGMCC3_g16759 [Colletotrichum fructicola]